MKKIKILVFNRFYLPGYLAGGPIRTLANMVDRLGQEFDFRIVTLDRDAGSDERYANVAHDQWNTVGDALVLYLSPSSISLNRIVEIISVTAPDVIYLNSFFDPTFTQRVLWARRFRRFGKIPIILAPRGEFSEGAIRLKATKKKIFLHASTLTGLYSNLIWQASSALERKDIKVNLRFVNDADIFEAMDLAPLEKDQTIIGVPRDSWSPLRICFLSRISPKKNLDFALRVLANVKRQVVFTIYGPKEDPAYWAECERLIDRLPSNIKVVNGGEVHPSDVQQALTQHDVFLFPTRGENYGHVIYEALRAGLLVLISDQTPWDKLFEQGVGWALPLNNEVEFAQIVDEVASWDEEKMLSVRRNAAKYARKCAVDPEVLNANRAIFLHSKIRSYYDH